ncbi:hypothetical protein SETIT_2G186100v2 [Setaria italica]|uniref:Uncharacterized protein n=1 Tax=Setaria italica TaxID=4555 RepID=A0A368Q2K0_SETIT|nr:hypothetical protein SETIT_2G186100v2 [Setaria italica]
MIFNLPIIIPVVTTPSVPNCSIQEQVKRNEHHEGITAGFPISNENLYCAKHL